MMRSMFWIFLLPIAIASGAGAADNVVIVRDGVPSAVIVTAPDASKQALDAAGLLSRYIAESTGAAIPVNPPGAGERSIKIHVGQDAYSRSRDFGLDRMDGDGFVIAAPDTSDIVIAGPTDWGTEFGVYEFLERYVGVRWLMPGPWGEDVPKKRTLAVPRTEIRQEPAYFSREFSVPNGNEWARRNRHHGRVSFHHNLINLFPPSRYTKTHPEFYPIWDGKRYLPTGDNDYMWQSCFSADGIVEEAVKNIKEYFRTYPEATSYSLGMNDCDHFCQCEKCLAKENPEKNFLGYRNYSDAYFEWANKVVEEVLKEYPDKWFGTLAYWCLAEPPKKVKVHPRIIPYMTYGRIRWFDPELRAEGHRLTEWWKTISPTLGWYDYIYGTPYLLPRVYFHQMAEYLRYGRGAGVEGFYAEIYYNWGEGPKEYLTLKLLWDPSINVDATLRDWYERAVGKAAAPELAAYYALWENFWTKRIRASSWFTRDGQWMKFYDPGYFDIVTVKDIAESRSHLEAAVQKAGTEAQKKRAGYLLRAFDWYEAGALTFLDEFKAFRTPPVSEQSAVGSLKSVEGYMSMKEKRWRLMSEFDSDPVLAMPLKSDRYRLLAGDRWGCYPLWAAYEWVKKGRGDAWKQAARLVESPVGDVSSHASLMRDIVGGKASALTKNPGFLGNLDGWEIKQSGTGGAVWSDSGAHDSPGVLAAHAPCVIEQRAPLAGNARLYTCLGFVKVSGTAKSPGKAEIALGVGNLQENMAGYEWLGLEEWNSTVVRIQPGRWVPVAVTVDVSKIPSEKNPGFVTIRLILKDFPEGSAVFVDDLGVYPHK